MLKFGQGRGTRQFSPSAEKQHVITSRNEAKTNDPFVAYGSTEAARAAFKARVRPTAAANKYSLGRK